ACCVLQIHSLHFTFFINHPPSTNIYTLSLHDALPIFQYENLEIEILDKNFGRDQTVFQRIGSFLANKLVIKSQNPDRKGELRKGDVYYLRDQNKFIFKYWWELVLSGLKSTITGDDEEDLRKKSKKS